jgi:8-oxo-dGTP pyrophosphatase MutT (NUDIX family)
MSSWGGQWTPELIGDPSNHPSPAVDPHSGAGFGQNYLVHPNGFDMMPSREAVFSAFEITASGTPAEFNFQHTETDTGGMKFPRQVDITAHHPETGEESGHARYYPPKRKGGPLSIDKVEGHIPGAASALLNEIESRHPGSATKFLYEVKRNNNNPDVTGHAHEHAGKPSDWDAHYPNLAPTLHRGLALPLSSRSARIVNSSSPKEEHLTELHDALPGSSLGPHWTEDEHAAQLFAHNAVSDHRSQIPVVLHAKTPARKDIETREQHLYRGGIFPYGDPHSKENEVPFRKGRTVEVTGMSWRPDHPHPDADEHGWIHHGYADHEHRHHTATVRAIPSGKSPVDWDTVGRIYPHLYGDPEVHGEASGGGDGQGIGGAVNHLAHDRPDDPGAESSSEHELEFHPLKSVPTEHIDYVRHPPSDSRVRYAIEGYQSNPDKVPPLVLVHRHGVYHVADGHHRAAAAAYARVEPRALVAYSPHPDEPFSDGTRGPSHGAEPTSHHVAMPKRQYGEVSDVAGSHVFRGVHGYDPHAAAESTRQGVPGGGDLGPGIYVAEKPWLAIQHAGGGSPDESGVVLHGQIHPDAKVGHVDWAPHHVSGGQALNDWARSEGHDVLTRGWAGGRIHVVLNPSVMKWNPKNYSVDEARHLLDDTHWQKGEGGDYTPPSEKEYPNLHKAFSTFEVSAALQVEADGEEQDYRISHQAPDSDYGAPLHDVEKMMPDFYTHPHYYDNGQEHLHESMSVVRRARGNPEKKVRIYRALEAEHAGKGFNTGDWVTTSKSYARDHGRMSNPKDDWPVISTVVPAKHLHTEGDIHEWAYNGPKKEWATVSHKGGYNQEVRQREDGTITPVKRRTSSVDWCAHRHFESCYWPGDNPVPGQIPQRRGACNWKTAFEQMACPMSDPGPMAGMFVKGAQDSTMPPWPDSSMGRQASIWVEAIDHEGAAQAPEVRFQFTATWADVRNKAKRIRREGGVRILMASSEGVVGEVRGDHNVYETQLTYVLGSARVGFWNCGCKWSAYAWGRSPKYKRFEGRMCSHALAMQFEAQARSAHGREIMPDVNRPNWLKQRTPVVIQHQRDKAIDLTRREVPPGNMRQVFSMWEMPGGGAAVSQVGSMVAGPLQYISTGPDPDLHMTVQNLAEQGWGVVSHLVTASAVCPECHAPVAPAATTCPHCGAQLAPTDAPDVHLGAKQDPEGPSVSGVVLKAADTGRILMLQRGLDDEKDPARGTWEFPGGHHEDGDTTSLHAGIREWEEEIGQPFPEGGVVHHTWTSPNGIYQGHVVVIPSERDLSMKDGRVIPNPDDPKGDFHEQAAWWQVDHAKKNPALRPEVKSGTPWKEIDRAGQDKKAARLAGTQGLELTFEPGLVEDSWWPLTAGTNSGSPLLDTGLITGIPVDPPAHSNSANPASSGFATSEDPDDWAEPRSTREDLRIGASWQPHEGFDAWRARLSKDLLENGTPHPSHDRLYRSVSDDEMHAAHQHGAFHSLDGKGLFVSDDPDRMAGGAYGGRAGGHIVEIDPAKVSVGSRPSYYNHRLVEKAVDHIPMDAVTRTWTWNGDAKDHLPSDAHRTATLHDEPEAALPSTDGDREAPLPPGTPMPTSDAETMRHGYDDLSEFAEDHPELGNSTVNAHTSNAGPGMQEGFGSPAQQIVDQFQRTAGAHALAAGGQKEDALDIATAARMHLEKRTAGAGTQKTALKDFSFQEQQQLINEGGPGVTARNLPELQIEGTHYQSLEAALREKEASGEDVSDIFVL